MFSEVFAVNILGFLVAIRMAQYLQLAIGRLTAGRGTTSSPWSLRFSAEHKP
jgi:hypothetical protein